MNTILLAFANSSESPLTNLSREDREVYKVLSQKASEEKDWHIQHLPAATIPDLIEDIEIYQDTLTVFLYSGHADKDHVLIKDEEANAEGVAAILGNCPNLKLVVLNGCSTEGQVKDLLAAGVPCVIATSSPIEDSSATQFSISFFTALANRNKSIQRAYEDGIAAAKIVKEGTLIENRGIKLDTEDRAKPIWGLFYPEGYEINLEWTLSPELIPDQDFIPNKLLLAGIWEAIAPFVSTPEERVKMNELSKIDKIITELPHPVSEYLRKLIAKSRPGEEEEVFYNELNFNRLQYLIYTYTTCIELLAFTLLAQFWDELSLKNIKKISTPLQDSLKHLFTINSKERKSYSFIPLIQHLGKCMVDNEIKPFIKEYDKVNEAMQVGDPFLKACEDIEKIRFSTNKQAIPDGEARPLCIEIEKHLSVILGQLGFLAKYKMTSMKDIYFIKHKHQAAPKYQLNFVELRYRPAGMDVITETLTDSMDNASIILLNQEEEQVKFLNLSPFIIDQNSFDDKAKLANLCVFQSFETIAKVFTFRYIYKPLDRPLVVKKSMDYFPTVVDQFNAFYQLIFNQKLIDYEKPL